MLAERLEDYFGVADADALAFIRDRESNYDESGLNSIYEWIITNRARKFGFPDISFISRAFDKIRPAEGKKYFWCVCNECGGEYWYSMPYCPYCWDKGLLCSSYTVKVSTDKPPLKVRRYNIKYTCNKGVGMTSEKKICYDCPHAKTGFSYCPDFGRTDFDCRDYRNCSCATCCAAIRGSDRKLEKHLPSDKPKFAVPIIKVSV